MPDPLRPRIMAGESTSTIMCLSAARQVCYLRGRSDTIDAENAARAVLSRTAASVAQTAVARRG